MDADTTASTTEEATTSATTTTMDADTTTSTTEEVTTSATTTACGCRSATNLCSVLIYAIYANLTRSHKFKFLFIHVNNSVRRSNALINI